MPTTWSFAVFVAVSAFVALRTRGQPRIPPEMGGEIRLHHVLWRWRGNGAKIWPGNGAKIRFAYQAKKGIVSFGPRSFELVELWVSMILHGRPAGKELQDTCDGPGAFRTATSMWSLAMF
jgi:hypothetical protein